MTRGRIMAAAAVLAILTESAALIALGAFLSDCAILSQLIVDLLGDRL